MEHTYNKELKKALNAASAVLDEKDRIESAIRDLDSQLPSAYREVAEARTALGEAQADVAMGREANVDHAKKCYTRANENLAAIADGILMLKGRLYTQEQPLSAADAQIQPLLPEFDEKAAAAFAPEWNAACAVWSKVLGRRAALETALGRRLDLGEPVALNVEVDPELAKPRQLLAAIQAALGTIRQARTMAQRNAIRTPLTFDETAIYEFVRDANINSRSYKAGEHVLGRLLGPAAFKFLTDTRQLKRVDEQMAAVG